MPKQPPGNPNTLRSLGFVCLEGDGADAIWDAKCSLNTRGASYYRSTDGTFAKTINSKAAGASVTPEPPERAPSPTGAAVQSNPSRDRPPTRNTPIETLSAVEAYGTDDEQGASDGSQADESIERGQSREASPDEHDDTVMGDRDCLTEALADRAVSDIFMAPAPNALAAQMTANDITMGLGHTPWKTHQRGRAEPRHRPDNADLGLGAHFDRFEGSLRSQIAPSLEQLRNHIQSYVAEKIAELQRKQAAVLCRAEEAERNGRKMRDELKSTKDLLAAERLRTMRMQQELEALKAECDGMRAVLEGRLPPTEGS